MDCILHMVAKRPTRRARAHLQQYYTDIPFHIDDPFPVSNDGNCYVLVVMDYFRKCPEEYPIRNQGAQRVVDVFVNNWVCRATFRSRTKF